MEGTEKFIKYSRYRHGGQAIILVLYVKQRSVGDPAVLPIFDSLHHIVLSVHTQNCINRWGKISIAEGRHSAFYLELFRNK